MILELWSKLTPETKIAVLGQILATILLVWRTYQASKKATFFERAHEAVVTGIEHSDCEDCRKAAKAVSEELGIEAQVKPIVKAIKSVLDGSRPH